MSFLKKLFDQANPFDNGKTWSNPQGNPQPVKQAPAQTPAPQGNMNFAGSKTYGTFNRPSPVVNLAQKQIAQTPKVNTKNRYSQVNAPSYGSGLSGILNRAKDVVDANTPQDQFKRNQQIKAPLRPNMTYQQQQQVAPSNLTRTVNLANSAKNNAITPMATLTKAAVGQVTGNQQARNNALNTYKQGVQGNLNTLNSFKEGIIGSSKQIGTGLAYQSKDFQNAQKAQSNLVDIQNQQKLNAIKRAKQGFNTQQDVDRFVKYADNLWQNEAEARQNQINIQKEQQKQLDPTRNALAIADAGLTALSFGVAGPTKNLSQAAGRTAFENAIKGGATKEVATQVAKKAATNEIIRQSALTGSMGGFQGAINPYITKDPGTVTPTDVITGAVSGGVMGGVLPGTFVAASKGAKPIQNALNRLSIDNQIGAVGKNVKDNLDPQVGKTDSVFRSESPNRYGIGQAELGSGLYAGSKEIAGRTADGKVVTDGLFEYKVNPSAKILDSSSDTFRAIDSKASNDPSLRVLDGRQWQQRKADLIAQMVQEQGYDGVRRGTNQIVAMSDQALIPVTKNAPQYKSNTAGVGKTDPTLSPKNQAVSTEPKQKLPQKTQPLSQGKQKEISKPVVDNTSAPIIPTESVKNPEAFIPEAKLASQGKPPKQATAKLLDSAKKSDVIPEDMVQAIDPTRSVKTNKETWTKAGQKLHELGDDGALNYFHENHGADSNAVAWRLYEKRLARGDNKGAQELLADMTTRSIENGQAAQAWAMIKRLDPKYITQKLDRQVDTFKKSDKYSDRLKKRIDWSADKQARISKYATDMSNDSTLDNLARTNDKDEIAKITSIQDEGIIKGLSKTNDPERIKMLLTTNFNKEINSILPSGFGDKAVAYWKSGLLSAPVTHVRNIVGNTTNSAFNTVETPIAGLLDSTFGRALTPTKRTVSANPLIGQGKGYKQGGQDFADALRYGITKDDAGKFDYKSINWNKNNPVEQHIFKPFTDAIFRTLGAEDKIFKQPGVMHSLYNQADAAAISAGKRGDAKWMANWVEKAPAIVKEQAKKEGGAWVFQKDTVVSTAMRGLKNAVKREHPGFEKVIDGIQPFVNVPAAIGSELLTYTPAGLLRVGNKARKALNKNIDMSTRDIYRREAMKDLSKTTVGGGLIAAGLAMGYSGDASGTMPPKNTKEYDVWMQENRQANSIRIGNKWFNINSIGPQASLFNAAAQTGAWMKRNEGKGKTNDPLTSAVAFGGNVATNWFNSSSLTGASNAQKAISDPVRYGQDYAARQLTSFIPNAAKRLGAGVDPNMREGDSFKDAVLAQIPFARTNAPVKTDSTGTPVVNNAYGAMGMKSLFDPFNVSTAKDGGNSSINKTASKSGMAVQDLKEAKQITKKGYGKEWAKLSEEDIKNKAIEGDQQAQKVYDSLQAQEKVYAKPNMPTPGLSKDAEDILNSEKKFTTTGRKAWGNRPTESKVVKDTLKSWTGVDLPVTNDVAVEWAKFKQKQAKGEFSPLEENEAKLSLARKAVSSQLSEDERQYYNVADDKLLDALSKGWIKPDSLAKAMDIDKQLLSMGLTSKSGFGKKIWNALGIAYPSVSGASSGTRRSSGRRSTRTAKAPKLKFTTTRVKNRQKSMNSSLRKLLGSAKV